MRVRIALFCLFASLLAGAAFAAGTPAAPTSPVTPALAAPAFLLPATGSLDGILWQPTGPGACGFRLNQCLAHCNGEVDCETICNCAWIVCTGQPLPDWC